MLYNNGEYAPQLTVGNSVGGGVSNIVTCTQNHLRSNGYNYATTRAISGWTTPIYNGEYRVAFRYIADSSGYISPGAYHFIYELSTGQWAGKYAGQPSYNHGFINPDLDEVGQWSYGDMGEYQTYYMAVKLT